MNDLKVKLTIDESVTPVAQKYCHVLFHLCDNEFKLLFDAGIIEPN